MPPIQIGALRPDRRGGCGLQGTGDTAEGSARVASGWAAVPAERGIRPLPAAGFWSYGRAPGGHADSLEIGRPCSVEGCASPT